MLTIPDTTRKNLLYLGGSWSFNPEYAEASTGSEVVFNYQAKNVYMVASSPQGASVEIWLDNKLVKTISVKEETLYPIIEGADYGAHSLTLKIKSGAFNAFTFTFG